MFIRIKGHTGMYNAMIIAFYKENIDELKRVIKRIYELEYHENIPSEFHSITTIKYLKKFVKENMSDMDSYPRGFKHIDGVFCVYECIG